MSNISDHQPYFIILDQIKPELIPPKTVLIINKNTPAATKHFYDAVAQAHINEKLKKDIFPIRIVTMTYWKIYSAISMINIVRLN